jgi:hypothetical protein
MADAENSGPEVAAAFFEAALKQSELLGSWSLTVFGACVLLLVWCAQKRLEKGEAPPLRALILIVASGVSQGASILFMYFAYGQMVNIIPVVQFGKADTVEKFTILLAQAGVIGVQVLFIVQFVLFFLGIALLGAFAIVNFRVVGAAAPAAPIPVGHPPTGMET